ncbi:hypothetical protein BN1708_001147 [Verticillium longisporum]|uniref:Uncharacterized protein n=1 Tax=Verticillium longisporum TaxID=100787 RepID=A0A0G4MH18_VERLO|nr:hypothetical protein BN1708_001147 [Verticillium longisporum]
MDRENDVESRPGVSLAMSNVSIMQKARKITRLHTDIASNEPPDGWGALRCLLAQWLAPVLRQLQSFASRKQFDRHHTTIMNSA